MKITICSSVDFSPTIINIKSELEKMGHEINIPYMTQKIITWEISYEEYMRSKEENWDILLRKAQSVDMIKRYWDFIRDSDAILVLNLEKKWINNYIWWSTLMEMWFAYGHNKKIFLYNPIPQRSDRIHYVDEIIDMKPIIINWDINYIK